MRISDWSSDVCSSDLGAYCKAHAAIETYGVLGYRDPTFQSLYKLRKKRDLTSDRLNLSLHAAHYLTADDIVPLLVLLLIETGLELECCKSLTLDCLRNRSAERRVGKELVSTLRSCR